MGSSRNHLSTFLYYTFNTKIFISLPSRDTERKRYSDISTSRYDHSYTIGVKDSAIKVTKYRSSRTIAKREKLPAASIAPGRDRSVTDSNHSSPGSFSSPKAMSIPGCLS